MKHPALEHLRHELGALAREHLLRSRPAPIPLETLTFSSNDYLGLASTMTLAAHSGARASRLIVGEHELHQSLERALTAWLQTEAALLFTSGYAANVGVLSALIQPNDIVVSDALNHASIIDGIRLTRANARVVPHLDVAAVANALRGTRPGRAWVVTESYFSMDADSPDMQALRAICDEANAGLIVDEAHALGVLGPEGRGVCAAANVIPDVLVGTLGKAFGTQGAFVTGPSHLIEWLWNRARSFVFSTGLSPVLAATAQRALKTIRRDPSLGPHVIDLADLFRRGLAARGLTTIGYGHVVPWILGDPERALRVAETLRQSGVIAHAIRPPTVPQGTSRIRFAITARHCKADIESALTTITSVAGC